MKHLLIAAALGLTACVTSPPPAVISDLESDKVLVQYAGSDRAVLDAEAQKGCAIHGKSPVPVSQRCWLPAQYGGGCLSYEYLFACK